MNKQTTAAQLDNDSNGSLIKDIVYAAAEIKAIDITALDVSKVFPLSDYFIIASGRSDRHVQGIVNKISDELAKKGIKPIATEGLDRAHWVLLDYGEVLVHIFYEQTRELYDLEALWVEAKPVDITAYVKEIEAQAAA